VDRSFYRFVTIPACDRRTDGRTDGQTEFSSQCRVCITCSAVKTNWLWNCWLGRSSLIWPIMCLVERWTLLNQSVLWCCLLVAEADTWVSGAGSADTSELLGLPACLLHILSLRPSIASHRYSHRSDDFAHLLTDFVLHFFNQHVSISAVIHKWARVIVNSNNSWQSAQPVFNSFIHSLDHLTGDGSLCPPHYSITGCVPCGISGESCVDFQLLHPRMVRPATWTFPLPPVVGRWPVLALTALFNASFKN